MIKAYRIRVTGKVQGVFFRASTKSKADELDVKGMVCNEPDGSVYIEAEGSSKNVEQFIGWCTTGPPQAQVHRFDMKEAESKGYEDFQIQL
jgi:acylphosphatase